MAIIDSLQWNQISNGDLVAKHPKKDLQLGIVLTVREGQEAYLYKNGLLYDSFTPGRYELQTENIPLLNKLVNLSTGGHTTFLAEVWFVSKLEKRDLLWGAGGIRVIDPYFQIPVKISSRGQYGIKIVDGALFLRKFISSLTFADTTYILKQFRVDVIEAVKVSIAQYMKDQGLNINEIGTQYRALAKIIFENLYLEFAGYGIELINFNIEDISIDESDIGYQKVMDGIVEKIRLEKLGVDYLQQKQLDIAQAIAKNEGVGNIMGLGIGISTGQQVGSILNNTIVQSRIGDQHTQQPPPPPVHSYYIAINNQTLGPFDLDVMTQKILSHEITAETYVYKADGTTWVKLKEDNILKEWLTKATLPPPPSI